MTDMLDRLGVAGRVVGAAIQAGDWSLGALSRYEDEWRAKYLREMQLSYKINRIIARFTDSQWDKGLDLLKHLSPDQAAALPSTSNDSDPTVAPLLSAVEGPPFSSQ